MKRYALFSGDAYYPAGGWNDLKGTFHTIEEARLCVKKDIHDWFQIVDLTEESVVVEEHD